MLGVIPDLRSPTSALLAVLGPAISCQACLAYKHMEKDYLLAFTAGFVLLALSFVLRIPIVFGSLCPLLVMKGKTFSLTRRE